jgi:hypothetical protein
MYRTANHTGHSEVEHRIADYRNVANAACLNRRVTLAEAREAVAIYERQHRHGIVDESDSQRLAHLTIKMTGSASFYQT